MRIYAASYNFPAGFLWGISPGEGFVSDSGNYAYLFSLQEINIKAISVYVKWAEFEPLKNNYDEKRIESVRLLLSRIRNQNIEPVVVFDVGEVPQWQNLEKGSKNDEFNAERYNFVTHLINALVPYTDYFVMTCSYAALRSGRQLQSEIKAQNEVKEYLNSISDKKKLGTGVPAVSSVKRRGGLRSLFGRVQLNALKTMQTDFIGLNTDKATFEEIQAVFTDERKPLLFISDGLKSAPPEEKTDILMDTIYDIWHIYQKGWPIMGLFSEIDIKSASQEINLYANSSVNNAFQISTENPDLPEKWVRFLKD